MKKEYKTTIVTLIIAVIAPILKDLLSSRPIWSSIWWGTLWFWNHVIRLEIELWVVFSMVFVVIIIRRFLISRKDGKTVQESFPAFFNYTKDNIAHVVWIWEWRRDQAGRWKIRNLKPLCPSCETPCSYYRNEYSLAPPFAVCPRCDYHINKIKEIDKIKAIIVNNANRGLFG